MAIGYGLLGCLSKLLTVCLCSVVHGQLTMSGDHESLWWTPPCPTNCSCTWKNSETTLTVDCQGRRDDEQLTEQLDLLLSSNVTYGRLTSLSILDSPLWSIPASVCRLQTLTQLDVSRNRLANLPDNCINNLTALTIFTAAENNITEIQDGVLDGMSDLVSVWFDKNNISSIGLRVFNASAGLTSLRWVMISHNRLTSLEPWFYYVAINGKSHYDGTQVVLYKNQISTFTNEMGLTFPCGGTKPMYGELDLGHNKLRHFTDILRGWNISGYEVLCMMNFRGGRSSIRPRIHENPIDCDCMDYAYYYPTTLFPHYDLFNGVVCHEPMNLYNERINSVPLDHFVCDITELCPPGCKCTYSPHNYTLHTQCSNINLTDLPLELPKLPDGYAKYKLDFSNNRFLRRLTFRTYFTDAWAVDVSNCNIDAIDDTSVWRYIVRIPSVNVFGNQLTSLPRSFASTDVTAEKLNLGGNPWDCSCENQWMSGWLKSIADQLTRDVLCYSPDRMRGKNIIQSTGGEFCDDPTTQAAARAWITSLSTVAVVILVLSLLSIAVYRLRTKMYTRWKFHPFDRDECAGENMDFDVFLCCSSLDDDARRILDRLEDAEYRVCIHDRDFRPGVIFDNIQWAVTRSKRVLCLLTNNFLQSPYCMLEFETALGHCVSIKRTRRLVVLMALDSPNDLFAGDASNTAALRQYLRQHTYIDYAAGDWVDKLLYALPMRGMMATAANHDVEPLVRPI